MILLCWMICTYSKSAQYTMVCCCGNDIAHRDGNTHCVERIEETTKILLDT